MLQAMLFSTNTEQDPKEIYPFYSLRFTIKFLFGDAKFHLGLQHCQAREVEKPLSISTASLPS